MSHASRIALALAFACALPIRAHAQTAPASLPAAPPHPAITLEPPSGWELQAHSFDARGTRLPTAPANFRRVGEARMGQPADIHTLTLRFSERTTLTSIRSTRDFRVENGGSCTRGTTYGKDATCTVLVRFTPQGPGNRVGHLLIGTGTSATPMAFGLGGYGYAPIVSFIPAQITTVPGSYPSNVGLLNGANNLAVDGGDTLWVADTGNNLVRNRDSSGAFKTLSSGFSAPYGIAVDTFGEAYFSRPASNVINEIYDYGPVVQASGTGTGSCPAATPCTLNSHIVTNPGELSIDGYNHLFFTEQTSGGAFSTVQPVPASLIFLYDPFPYQVSPTNAAAMDNYDNIYSLWSSSGNCEIVQQTLYNAENSNVSFVKIAGGHTCGFAGDGGLAGNAEIGSLVGQITFDAAGDLYFSDSKNQRVRRIDYNTGIIRTVAGNGAAGYSGDGQSAQAAKLNNPTGVAVDSQGSMYIISNSAATGSAQVIRKVGPTGYVAFGNQSKGVASASHFLNVTNTGNSAMVLTGTAMLGTSPGDFKIDATTTTCMLTQGATLYAGQTCTIGFKFTPAATGLRQGLFRLLTNTNTGYDDTILSGTGTLPAPTLKITSPANGSSFTSGTAITFSASVTYPTAPQPTGTVQFKVDGANYGSAVTLSSTGTASTSVTGLTQTTHTLSVTYSGDSNYAATGPVSVSVTVTALQVPAVVTLSSGVKSGMSCTPLQFTVNVTGSSGPTATGTVRLVDAGSVLASGTLSGGQARLTAQVLLPGRHTIVARYSGDTFHLAAQSAALTEVAAPASSCAGPIRARVARDGGLRP